MRSYLPYDIEEGTSLKLMATPGMTEKSASDSSSAYTVMGLRTESVHWTLTLHLVSFMMGGTDQVAYPMPWTILFCTVMSGW
jgi:hypothetical protein